jgi:hypothetical protein
MCQSRFWCTSCVSSQILSTIVLTENIESIPIAENEGYRFYYDNKRGLAVEFLR